MYPRVNREMAQIEVMDKKGPGSKVKVGGLFASKGTITFPFNPFEMTLTRGKSIDTGPAGGSNDYQGLQWKDSAADELSFAFYLDESEPTPTLVNPLGSLNQMLPILPIAVDTLLPAQFLPSPDLNSNSVLDVVNALYSLTLIIDNDPNSKDQTLRRPSFVKFMFGEDFKFAGAVSKLEYTFELFDSDGTPKRAKVSMSLTGRYVMGSWPSKEDLRSAERAEGSASL